MLQACATERLARMLCRLGFELDITPWQGCWPQGKPDQASDRVAQALSGLSEPVSDADDPAADESVSCPGVVTSEDPEAFQHLSHDSLNVYSLDRASGMYSGGAVSHQAGTCQEFIEELRRSRFGIGIEVPEHVAEYVRQQEETVQQLSQALSDGLYSKNLHFVLELLQNSDDTTFAPGVTPTVEFVLEADNITVYTNEVASTDLRDL